MNELLLAAGLVLAVEGTIYALFPKTMRDLMARMMDTPLDTMRVGGVVALAAGVAIVWLARS